MSIVEEAQKIVSGKRQEDYGSINDSFQRIAGLWSAYTGFTIDKYDVDDANPAKTANAANFIAILIE